MTRSPSSRYVFTVRWDEVRLFTRFMHPRVLRLFEIGAEGRRSYAAMPWISARSLLACLEDDRGLPWPVDAALSVGWDIALGLGALHLWTLDGRPLQAVYSDPSVSSPVAAGVPQAGHGGAVHPAREERGPLRGQYASGY